MRDELIKLNKALNGIGYKDLIKIADEEPKTSSRDLVVGKKYQLSGTNAVFECIENTYANGSGEILVELKSNAGGEPFDIPPSLGISFYDLKIGRQLEISPSPYSIWIDITDRVDRGEKFSEDAINTYLERKEVRNTLNPIIYNTSSGEAAGAITIDEASSYFNMANQPAQTSGASTKPVVAAKHPLNSSIKNMNYYDNNWTYKIIDEKTVEVGRKSDGESFTIRMDSYKNWNNFKKNLEDGIRKGTITSDDNVSVKTKEPVTPAATSTPPAVAPTATGAAQPSTGGLVTETVDERPAVSIGTFFKDQIFLIIDSVKNGKPEFYIKDVDTGRASLLGKDDGRVRRSLGRWEISSLSKRLADAGLTPGQIEGFKRYMNLQRRGNIFGPLGRNKRDEKMKQDVNKMRSEAREERLDRLKKKGVI
jgi:hypothetical protein